MPLIVGDSAYVLSDWLMKLYTDNGNLTQKQVNFNEILSMTRAVVENAYGRLKGRFRSIAKRLDLNVETVCLVIAACCVLHNFCEVMGEDFNEKWLQGVQLHPGFFPNRPKPRTKQECCTHQISLQDIFIVITVRIASHADIRLARQAISPDLPNKRMCGKRMFARESNKQNKTKTLWTNRNF